MNNDDIHGLSGAYAVDAVDDVERAQFEAHLNGCSQCQIEVASLSAAAGEMALVTLVSPPPSLRASVLQGISSVRPLPPRVTSEGAAAPESVAPSLSEPPSARSEPPSARAELPSVLPEPPSVLPEPFSLQAKRADRVRRAPLRQWLVGVAAAAALATGGVVWQPWSSDTNMVQLSATQQVLQAKDRQVLTKRVGEATATVVRSPSLNQAVIQTANMPDAPAGKVYELWLQQGGKMVKAGFMPAGPANEVLLSGDAGLARGVGITVEPAGGSQAPTQEPIAFFAFA